MAVESRTWLITPGDNFGPIFEATAPFRVCAGTIQARNGGVQIGVLGSDQVFMELTSLQGWSVDGIDLSRLVAKQTASGGSATISFIGTVHKEA